MFAHVSVGTTMNRTHTQFTRRLLAVGLFLAAGLSACSESTEPVDDGGDAMNAITGRVWKLTAFENTETQERTSVEPHEVFEFRIDGDAVQGVVGCADFSCTFSLTDASADPASVSFQSIELSGSICDAHPHSDQFLAALETVVRYSRSGAGNDLTLFGEDSQSMLFELSDPEASVAVDLNSDGTEDVECVFYTEADENDLLQNAIDFIDIKALGTNSVLGGGSDDQSYGAPLLKGMPISNNSIPPFIWGEQFHLAARPRSVNRPGVWEGNWSDGSPYYVGVSVAEGGQRYYGWVRIKLNTDDEMGRVRVLGFRLNQTAGNGSRAGE